MPTTGHSIEREAAKALPNCFYVNLRDPSAHAQTLKLILHAGCLTDAESIRDHVKFICPDIGAFRISTPEGVIGPYTSPGLPAVFYQCKERISE